MRCRRGLVAGIEKARVGRVVQPVNHSLRNGNVDGDASRIRIEARRDGRQMALRFSDLFLVRQQRAPRENLDRLPGCRLREFIPRQGQKPNDIQPLFFDNLHAVKRRRIVDSPR